MRDHPGQRQGAWPGASRAKTNCPVVGSMEWHWNRPQDNFISKEYSEIQAMKIHTTRFPRGLFLRVAAAGVALAVAAGVFASTVYADNVNNDVTVGGTDTFALGSSTTVNYWIVATGGDGQSGCNASDGTAATVTINSPPEVTPSPGTLVFDDCGKSNEQSVVFTATEAGEYEITVSVQDAGAGSYHTTPAGFTLQVQTAPAAADTTPPTITIVTPANGAFYLLNEVVLADYSCEDEADGSGLASCDGDVESGQPIDTSSVGVRSFTVNAADDAGNDDTLTHTYSVVYDFDGFYNPVRMGQTNMAQAGRAIPMKFSLNGDQGLDIIASGYPKSQPIACNGANGDELVTETAGNSSLSYDSQNDEYTYVWKTERSWSGQCRLFVLELDDGTQHTALFQFR
jgi:hypothetical protein